MSINSDIRDMMIHHAVDLDQFSATELRKIRRLLAEDDRLLRIAINDSGKTPWSRRRLNALLRNVKGIEARFGRDYNRLIRTAGRGLAEAEVSTTAQIITTAADELITTARYSFVIPSPEVIWSAANSQLLLLDGKTATLLRPFVQGVSRRRLQSIESSLRYSFSVGETTDVAARRLIGTASRTGAVNVSRNSAQAVARTSYNHMSSVARRQTYEKNEDLIRGYEWVSTLDRRTSAICQDFDGRVWIFEDDEVQSGETLLPGEEYPPAHGNCRSTTTPITRSWQELGIDRDELPASTRASADGQVPERTTYYGWLGRQSAGTQRGVLGATRYKMFQDGTSFTEFHGSSGRLLTLEQLGAKGYTVPPLSAVRVN